MYCSSSGFDTWKRICIYGIVFNIQTTNELVNGAILNKLCRPEKPLSVVPLKGVLSKTIAAYEDWKRLFFAGTCNFAAKWVDYNKYCGKHSKKMRNFPETEGKEDV